MIAGTQFTIQPLPALRVRPNLTAGLAEVQAECEADRATCLVCEDVVIVFDLRARDGALEMFVWLAVALKHGAFERQAAAVCAVARDLGATTVAFESRRRGWARRLGPEWHPRGTREFVREV